MRIFNAPDPRFDLAIQPPPHGHQDAQDRNEGYNFCPVHGFTLADSEVPAHVRSAFSCLYPYQPNIGRYWPLFAAHSVHATPDCWLPTGPANQPQGGKGGRSPLLHFLGGGRGFFGRACESKKGRIRAAFFARADYRRLKED